MADVLLLNRNDTLRERAAFKTFASEYLQLQANLLTSGASVSPDLSIELGKILFELIENSHKHGRKQFGGVEYPDGFRSYIGTTRFQYGNKQALQEELLKGQPDEIQTYIRGFGGKLGRRYGFTEISIIDSGPGLARHLGRITNLEDISIERELELVTDCFKTMGNFKQYKGKGGSGSMRF